MDDLKVTTLVDKCKVLTDLSERGFVELVDNACGHGNSTGKNLIMEWFYMVKDVVDELHDVVYEETK